MKKLIGLALLSMMVCTGCSTLTFSRYDGPFDGTYHAASSLVCSGYWSNRDWDRKSKERTITERIVPTAGLALYSLIDLPFSVIGDIAFLIPNGVIQGGPSSAVFDKKEHEQPWRCGSLSSSIHVVGAL